MSDYYTFGMFERAGLAIILLMNISMTFAILGIMIIERGGGGPGFESGMQMLMNGGAIAIMAVMFGRPLLGAVRSNLPMERLKGVV